MLTGNPLGDVGIASGLKIVRNIPEMNTHKKSTRSSNKYLVRLQEMTTTKYTLMRTVVRTQRLAVKVVRSSPRHVVKGTIVTFTPQIITSFVIDHDPVTASEVIHLIHDTVISSALASVAGVLLERSFIF